MIPLVKSCPKSAHLVLLDKHLPSHNAKHYVHQSLSRDHQHNQSVVITAYVNDPLSDGWSPRKTACGVCQPTLTYCEEDQLQHDSLSSYLMPNSSPIFLFLTFLYFSCFFLDFLQCSMKEQSSQHAVQIQPLGATSKIPIGSDYQLNYNMLPLCGRREHLFRG